MGQLSQEQVALLYDGTLNCMGESRLRAGVHLSLLPDCRDCVSSCLTLPVPCLTSVMDCVLSCEQKQSLRPFSCYHQVSGIFVTTARKFTNVVTSQAWRSPCMSLGKKGGSGFQCSFTFFFSYIQLIYFFTSQL